MGNPTTAQAGLITMLAKVVATALALLLLLPLPPLALGEAPRSLVKMQRSNPVVSAVVDGVALNLVLTTDMDGAWVCLDLDASKSAAGTGVDFGANTMLPCTDYRSH